MGGNDSCNGKFRYGLKEHSRTTQLVGRICSLQYFIEDYQRIAVFLTFTNKLFQTQQFCIEITYAMSKASVVRILLNREKTLTLNRLAKIGIPHMARM